MGASALAAGMTFVAGLVLGAAIAPVTHGQGNETGAVSPTPIEAPKPATLRAGHPVEILRVIDGDTFLAQVHVWPGIDITTKVRRRGIDAPEFRARCSEEFAKANAAREALLKLLAEGEVAIAAVSLDKYGGRVLADASTRGTPDISAALLATGLVRPYGGGRREGWCQ